MDNNYTAGDIIVGSGSAVAGVAANTVVGAVTRPIIDAAVKVNAVTSLIQNPSLGGALAILGQGFPPYANELDQFVSYSYNITLSCLTGIEANFPLTYRTLGPLVTILKSGGVGGIKVPSIYETDGLVEFFIEDLDVHEMVAPRPETRQTNATSIKFKVVEPYSMGQFFQNLRAAALVTGNLNYIEAPFLITIEFIGYDDEGNVKKPFLPRRYFPIKLIEANMTVTGSGSVYEVTAVPWNEQALFNEVQTLTADFEGRGETVAQVLQTGAVSLSQVLNQNQQQLRNGQVVQGNEYVIQFPTSTFTLGGLAASAKSAVSGAGNVLQDAFRQITGTNVGNRTNLQTKLNELGVNQVGSSMAGMLRAEAESTINEIGSSVIVKSWLDAGNSNMGEAAFVEAEDNPGVFTRRNLAISDNGRVFTFRSGTRIQEIIEEVILLSEYGRSIMRRVPNAQGMIPWFKIETHTYNADNLLAGATTGQSPKVYVYRVIPYMVDASRFTRPTFNPVKNFVQQAAAVKAYNYIYTGQNKDIIDFDIKFNYAFYTGLQATRGQMQRDSKTGGQTQAAAGSTTDVVTATQRGTPGETPAEGNRVLQSVVGPSTGRRGGGAREHVETQVARMFNDALVNSKGDMLEVDLKIAGDPFWISDSGLGNYIAIPNPANPAMTLSGGMNPSGGEILIVINFRTPIDYDGDDGFVKWPMGGFLPVAMFSGVFRVLECRNEFTEGKFIQNLKCVRLPNQEFTLGNAIASLGGLFNKAVTEGTPADRIDRTNANELT